MPKSSKTYRGLGSVPLEAGYPFTFPLYRGFELRPILIQQSQVRYSKFEAIAKRQQFTKLTLRAFSRTTEIPVWIDRIEPQEGGRMSIVLHDSRKKLARLYNPMNVNVRLADDITNDAIVNDVMGVKRTPYYLADTTDTGDTTFGKPRTVYTAVQKLFDGLKKVYPVDGNIPYAWGTKAGEIARDWIVPDNPRTAGETALEALRVLLEPAALSIVCDTTGKVWITDAESDNVHAMLNQSGWLWEAPPWKKRVGGGFTRPVDWVVPYYRREEIQLQIGGDVAEGAEGYELNADNVFRNNRGQFLQLSEYLKSVSADLTGTEITDAIIAEHWFSDNWSGTLLQQEVSETAVIGGLAEGTRLAIAQIAYPEIKARWRKTFKVRNGDGTEDIAGRAGWKDIVFGTIPISSDTASDDVNTIRDPVKLDQNVFTNDGVSTYAVDCPWVDTLSQAEIDPAAAPGGPFIAGLRWHKDNVLGVAPFIPAWLPGVEGVFDLSAIVTDKVTARIPGTLAQNGGILKPGDPKPDGIPNNRILGGAIIAAAKNAPRAVAPTLSATVVISVYVTGTRRTPQDRSQFYETKVKGYPDGRGTWYLPAAMGRYANFSFLDRKSPINKTSVEKDAKFRVAAVQARHTYTVGGIGSKPGLDGADVVPQGPHAETEIVSGSHGLYTLFTRVMVGPSVVADKVLATGGKWTA